MREIKYKAIWNEKSYEVLLIDWLNDLVYLENVNIEIPFNEVELLQYTGLKDENGIEVYEGDIIWDAHDEVNGKVIFDEGMFCVEWETHIERLFEITSDYHAENLGDTYQRPELLGDSQ